MYSFWKFFITQNRFSFLLLISLAAAGLFSLASIARESSPEVQVPVGVVTTILPGAAAADVESLITNKIEQGLSGDLENVSKITSSSREGVSSIVVEFEADADIDSSIQDLKDKVDLVITELPSEAEDPRVSEVNFVDQPIMTIAIAGDLTDGEFSTLSDKLETQLERVPSVSRVEFAGVRNREVTLIVDQASLDRFDLALTEVVQGIAAANANIPVGSVTTNGIIYNVAFEGDITDTTEIRTLPIASRGGQPVYVRDVAYIEDGYREATTFSRYSENGEPSQKAISASVYKSRGGDITRITEAVNERLVELSKPGELLDGLTASTILDSGEDIKKELWNLTRSGMQTVLLVILLLIVAIGWREGLLAGLAIPLSFTIGFVGLYASGNTINFVSLFALILAVGILVDSAIVVVEGINARMKEDPTIDKKQAALKTIHEFYTPLTAGTLTTVAMFSGLFLVGGVSGQFISAIPFTINFVLFASLLVALGLIPLIASLFLKRRSQTELEKKQVYYSHKLENWYRTKIDSILQNRKQKIRFVTFLVIGFFLALALPITGIVKSIFFDTEDIDWIYAELELPQATALEMTDISARRAEEILYTHPEIKSFVTTVGASSAFASNSGGTNGQKFANFFITLTPDREHTSVEIVEELRIMLSNIGEAKTSTGQPDGGPPTGSPIVIKFKGDDLEELTHTTLAAAEYLKTIPGTTNVTTGTQNNSTEFVLTLNKARAVSLGLDPRMIANTLRTALYGTEATSITTPNDDIDIVVKLALNRDYTTARETSITTIESLENLSLSLPDGSSVLVGAVADVSVRESSSVINHDDTERVISLSSDLTVDGNLREVTTAFLDSVYENVDVPDSVTLSFGGENEESAEAFKDMFIALIVGVLLMLAVLVLQFNSFRHTFYVLSILPFSLIGIMVGLAITGKALSFPSIMGFIALSGIVVNNSILLIDHMNMNRRKHPERQLRENVVEAAVSRLRPILLTTLTTVIGMIPLTYVSDLWSPLAWAIIFGLSFSVLITLVLIPIIYLNKPGTLD